MPRITSVDFKGRVDSKGRTKIDRRDFLNISAAAAMACFAPKALAGNQNTPVSSAPGISLRAEGDATDGYRITILFEGTPIVSNRGEVSAVFQNGERSLEDRITNWKAKSWKGDHSAITLRGDALLRNLNATVFIEVNYEVVAPGIVRKRIRFRQSDMFMLYYQVTNRIEPCNRPAKFWSFDQGNCGGGPLREYFPSAGYRTQEGLTVGLLTDAGFRNRWSRMYRRDGKPIKPALAAIPDPNLYVVASLKERGKDAGYVQQTFGEELQRVAGNDAASMIELPAAPGWRSKGAPLVKRDGEITIIQASQAGNGVVSPVNVSAGNTYSLEFEYRSNVGISVAILDLDQDLKEQQNFNQFNDQVVESPDRWTSFRSTVFVPNVLGKVAVLAFSLGESAGVGSSRLELRRVKLGTVLAQSRPYHRLEMDESSETTVFIFADQEVADTLRGYRLASQLHLANALHFKGGDTEKVLYADLMMLCWNAGTETFRPMLAPSIYYSAAGEMYLRDSFFALNGIHNKQLNQQVFNLWADNQGEDGAINTLVEPEMTNLERKSNDSTPLWLTWALLNQRRFGIAPPMEKVKKAAEYCLSTYDPKGDGACFAQFVMGQLDIVSYPEGTSTLCQNQGLLAVTLRVIRELRIPDVSSSISDQHIERSEQLYRGYYDPKRKYMLPARNLTGAIGFAELFPEYLSLWLFTRKILADEMVLNHLDRMPPMMPNPRCPFPELGGTVRPVFIGLSAESGGWRFFTEDWHPMASDSYARSYANRAMDGVYYNGGSWMRIEVCGYVTGKMHGWTIAEKAIKNRLWAEINASPDFPTSQEYLATDPKHPFYGSHRVFAWNSFVLQALELAGLRSPDMDPDYGMRS